jgi:hypothetical protein
MFSILSGVKPRASQRGRNNCLTLELENGALPDFLGEPRPPTMWRPGAGGVERSHSLKLNYNARLLCTVQE